MTGTATKPKLLIRRKFGKCPECKSNLLHHCVKNGVNFVQGGRENPTAIWNADIYHCPGCGNLVLTDFADRPKITFTDEPAWFRTQYIEALKNEGEIVIYGK